MRTYFVYVLASQPHGTLYIGVTNDLLSRVEAHRNGAGSAFTAKHGVSRLVHFEQFTDITAAIQREKSLKRYRRDWKLNLIERENPGWRDLYPELRALPGNTAQEDFRSVGPRHKAEDDSGEI